MNKLALIAIAGGAAALAPQAASAQVFVHPGFGGHHGFGGGNFFGGFAFGGFFHQPQFHVQNWQLYGFIQPGPQQRWVRYYDDAYLVDRRGYIHDRRQRVNWDRYGERWERDERGIPYYAGRGDYHPDGRDYEYVERERGHGGWDYGSYGACSPCGGSSAPAGGYAHGGGYSQGGYSRRVVTVPAPMPLPPSCGRPEYVCSGGGHYGHSGYPVSYGSGCGASYGCGGTVIVTETTVTPMTVVTEEIIEEEIVEERAVRRHRPARRVHHRRAPAHHRPAPPPPPVVIEPDGERG